MNTDDKSHQAVQYSTIVKQYCKGCYCVTVTPTILEDTEANIKDTLHSEMCFPTFTYPKMSKLG